MRGLAGAGRFATGTALQPRTRLEKRKEVYPS